VDAGIEITVPNEEQMAVWREKLQPLEQTWIDNMNGLGENGQVIYDEFRSRLDEEMKKAGK
jgi:hypothetical protein